jgi:hypothetical protein
MAFEGKLVKSRRKTPFGAASSSTFAPKTLQFATQMTAGQTDINLTSLTVPSSMPGFINASTPDLLMAHIYAYKNNLTLTRSDGSLLIPYLEYIVVSDTVIRLLTPAQAGTIVYGTINNPGGGTVTAVGGNAVSSIDGFNIIASGQLAVGQTLVPVGSPFQLFANPSSQIGSVLVFRNGRLMLRNDGNATASPSVTSGNYQEVPSGIGLTNSIAFDRPGVLLQDGSLETYAIVSNGLVALAPTDSVLAITDAIGGQLDLIIEVLSAVSGMPVSFFQGSPNQVDLRVFGNNVLTLQEEIQEFVAPTEDHARFGSGGAASFGSVNTGTYIWSNIVINIGDAITPVVDNALGSYFLINETGLYSIFLIVRNSQNGGQWIMKNVPSPASTAPSGDNPNLIAYSFNDQVTNGMPMSNTVYLVAGDKVFSGNDATGTNNGTAFFEITKVR